LRQIEVKVIAPEEPEDTGDAETEPEPETDEDNDTGIFTLIEEEEPEEPVVEEEPEEPVVEEEPDTDDGESPGQSGDALGQGGDSPGNSEDAPGQGGDSPGNSGDAPGQGGDNPGNGNGNNNDGGDTTTDDTDTSGDSAGPGNSGNAGNGNNNGNGNTHVQSSDTLIQDLVNGLDELPGNADVFLSEVNGKTVLVATMAGMDDSGLQSSASLGDLTVDWGYWSLPGLLSSKQEISREDFQRVYLAVVEPANMDDLKSTSGSWSFSSEPNQFTGTGTGGTLTGLQMGFDVNLDSGAVSNGSFVADVGYGQQSWSMNFTGSVEGATATMGNFSDTLVITPDGVTGAIHGSLDGVFTGAGDIQGFVSGFSLTSGSEALGGFGLLRGTPE